MKIRVLFAIAVLTLPAVESDAKGPFSRLPFRSTQRATKPKTKALATQTALRRLLKDPQEMTRRYGASVLVREGLADVNRSRFVRQPN